MLDVVRPYMRNGTDPCAWTGVTCEAKRVVGLDLSYAGLTELPESFGQLTALQTLDLRDNDLTELPESFYDIKNLTHFDHDPDPFHPCPDLRKQAGGQGKRPFQCVCVDEYYDTKNGKIHCCDADETYSQKAMTEVGEGCEKCPPCVVCGQDGIVLAGNYSLNTHEQPLSERHGGSVAVFRCPIDDACLPGNATTLCAGGYQGATCGDCADEWIHRSNGTCEKCNKVVWIVE